jgi:DNA-binding response OmpR family regulator
MTRSAKSRAIVVDDDKAVADYVALVLRHAGFEVSTFYSALPAAQYAREFAPDLVVTDYSMPDMNGLVFAYWLRENFPSCKVVIISGEISVVERAAKGGPSFTLLQKPFNLKVLLAAIR